MERLLKHPLVFVRYHAIQVILVAATSAHGSAMAKVVALVQDPNETVQIQALQCLARAP